MRRKVRSYAEVLARLLEESGLSAYRLSKHAGLSHAVLSYMLKGERQPTAETLERILRAAGQTWAWLDANLAAVEMPREE